jgi:hypothetical protein
MSERGGFWARVKGKVVRPVAEAAGDRRSEAKAEFQAHTAHTPSDSTLDVVEHAVREHHGDVEPSAERR